MGYESPHRGRNKSNPLNMSKYTYCDSCAEENMLPPRTGKRKVTYCIGCDKYCSCIVATHEQIKVYNLTVVGPQLDKERERR